MKNKFTIGLAVGVVILIVFLWLRWGPDSWDVQITGVTGDGRDVQYRIETVHSGTAETMIFRHTSSSIPRTCSRSRAESHGNARRNPSRCTATVCASPSSTCFRMPPRLMRHNVALMRHPTQAPHKLIGGNHAKQDSKRAW